MIRDNTKKIFLDILIIFSLVVFLYTLSRQKTIEPILCILPLSNMIALMPYKIFTANRELNVGSILIITTYFIRNVISPLFYCIASNIDNETVNHDKAILIMAIETIVAISIMTIVTKKIKPKCHASNNINIKNSFGKSSKTIILILTIATFILVVRYPQILNIFKIGYLDNGELTQHYIEYGNAFKSMPRLIFYLLSWSLTLLKYIFILQLLLAIKNNKIIKKKILFSFALICLCLLINTDTNAQSLIFAIIYVTIMLDMYKNKRKTIVTAGALITIVFLLIGLFTGINNDKMALRLNAYFGGIHNVAIAINTEVNKPLEAFGGDILRAIPLFKTFFVNMNDSTTIFINSIGKEGQIVPLIGQSVFYLGTPFACGLTIIFILLTLKFENNAEGEKDITTKFLYLILTIASASSIVVYNEHIFFRTIFSVYVPLSLLLAFDKKKRKKTQ